MANAKAEIVLEPPMKQLSDLADWFRQMGYEVTELNKTIKIGRVHVELFPPLGCIDEPAWRGPVVDPGDRPWRYGVSGYINALWGATVVDTREDVLEWLSGNPIIDKLIGALEYNVKHRANW